MFVVSRSGNVVSRSGNMTFVITDQKLAAIWSKLTKVNVACACCSSDIEYVGRVNEIADIIGVPHWKG